MRRLAKRGETDTVEFKSGSSDVDAIVAAAVCFSNGEGGRILWGVDDDGRVTGTKWRDLDGLRNHIYRTTSPSQLVTVNGIDVGSVQVIVIDVPHSNRLVSTVGGHYTQRVGTECLPMTPDRLIVRQIDTHALDASHALTPLPPEVLDPLEIERYRSQLPEEGAGSGLRRLNDLELLRAINAVLDWDGRPRVTVAGLLVLGRAASIRDVLPQHEVNYVRLPAGTTTYDRRLSDSSPLLVLIERLRTEIQAGSRVRTLRMGARDLEVPDYPERVIREAIVNALAHRHLSLPGPISIRQTNDSIEIENPGGFPEGITVDTVIRHAPVHRNKLLCEILDRVRYMERSGLGVDRIFEDQLRFGKLPPAYLADRTMVRLRLDASKFDEPFARFVLAEELGGRQLTVEDLLLLSSLRRLGPLARPAVARAIQRTEEESQDLLNELLARHLVDRWGAGTGLRYGLSARVQTALGAAATYTRERGLAREYQRSIVMQHARQFGRIDNRTVRDLLSVSVGEATQILKRLGERGDLLQVGSRRWAHWVPAPEQLQLEPRSAED